MRRRDKRGEQAQAWTVFEGAPVMHLATTDCDGQPVLRALHGVVVDGAIAFHGARRGEKNGSIGRRAVVSAHEVVGEIPSTFSGTDRACPATTYYRSAMLHGVLEDVEDLGARARALQALMERFQPQGGYVPITAEDPRYTEAVRTIRVLRVRPERIEAKLALGQQNPPRDRRRVVEALWSRGEPGDERTIEAMLAAAPLDPLPAFLRGPSGVRWVLAPDEDHVAGAVALLASCCWNRSQPLERIAAAQRSAQAWVVGLWHHEVVATARAVSDGVRTAYVADVAVAESLQGIGVGRALMATLRAHPAVRRTDVFLLTVNAGGFYQAQDYQQLLGRQAWVHRG